MKSRSCARSAFTLIELLVVIMILAAVAALVIPMLGFARDQADAATAASGAADTMNNLETFKVSTGSYPERMDSLLDSASLTTPYSRLWTHGGPNWFASEDLASFSPDASYSTSLAHSGIATVMDHDETAEDPNSSGTVTRSLFGGSMEAAVITNATVLGRSGVQDINGDGSVDATDIPDTDGDGNPDVKYVAFGIGPQCSAVGTTMVSAPYHSAAEPEDYGRFIAVFAVYESGKGAQLQTVLDSRRIGINDRIQDYREASPDSE